ncbi:MAG TPA: MerR family transcriptional regulator [Dehalococcoidia bacterium]|nr:MerR family transcriptional regulator [Dehalococcoidia bacterium]
MARRRREDDEELPEDEPLYVISVAARMVGMHEQTLRYYERMGIIRPARSKGRIRLYSRADIQRLRQVQRLMDELGVNLAGAEAILKLREHIQSLERQIEELRRELQAYRDRLLPAIVDTDRR